MKKMLIALGIILAFGMNSYAQEEVKSENQLSYSADDIVKIEDDKNTIVLIGNAELKTSVFEFQNADKIVIDKASKEVLIMGTCKVVSNEGIIQQAPILRKNHIRYKIGEKVAYYE